MNKLTDILKSRNKILSVIEILLGIILLIKETYQMITLPSMHTEIYGGLVDLFKYKENTYFPAFLSIMVIIIGTINWIYEDNKWTIRKVLHFVALLLILIILLF